jgi:type I restriction enzyme, S subunit
MRYEEYKIGEYDWLPEIPAHWQQLYIQQVSHEQKNKNIGMRENLVLSLSYGQIIRKKNVDAGLVAKDLSTYQIVDKDNIILRFTDLQNDHKSLRTGLVKERGIITAAYTCIVPTINAAYLHYALHSYDTRKVFYGMGGGVRQSIGFDDIRHMYVPVPPREEQDQIVRYLDWKVSCINKLIHGYQRQIKLLEERRQTIIDRAALEGVDGAKPKDSGTHWVKRIPENWKMVYSKKLFAERKDKAFPEDEQLTASQKYGVISQKEFIEREGRRVTVVLTGSDILKHVGIGDFIISMRSFQGGLEYSYVEGKISSAYVMLIPRKEFVYDEYFKWLLKSKPYIKALQGTSDLVRDGQALRYANFAKVPLPQIPLDEQKRIAEYIEIETSKIDAAIPVFEKQITLLKEYRTRLISDVVTGQIDVRGVVIPDYMPEDDAEENEADEEVSMDAD